MRQTGERKEKKHGGRGPVIALALLVWLLLTAVVILLIDARTVRFYV